MKKTPSDKNQQGQRNLRSDQRSDSPDQASKSQAKGQNDRNGKNQAGLGSRGEARDMTSGRRSGNQ